MTSPAVTSVSQSGPYPAPRLSRLGCSIPVQSKEVAIVQRHGRWITAPLWTLEEINNWPNSSGFVFSKLSNYSWHFLTYLFSFQLLDTLGTIWKLLRCHHVPFMIISSGYDSYMACCWAAPVCECKRGNSSVLNYGFCIVLHGHSITITIINQKNAEWNPNLRYTPLQTWHCISTLGPMGCSLVTKTSCLQHCGLLATWC